MVKNITGIVAVICGIFMLYRVAVCASSKSGFKVSDIVLIAVCAVILIASIIVRIKFGKDHK